MKAIRYEFNLRKSSLITMFIITLLFFTFFFVTKTVFASNSKIDSDKMVTSITIEKDDTLWSIASDYITNECGSMNHYIEEIKDCNGLTSDTIHEGQHLIIPYYEVSR